MAYSHARLRKTLAFVRILTGIAFLVLGQYKVGSLEFAEVEFPIFLRDAIQGNAVAFYGHFLNSFVWDHTRSYAVLIGLMELFIGVSLVLGLAVRPVALLGIVYCVHMMLSTWWAPGLAEPAWRYVDNEFRVFTALFLFLLFAVGHAGENWGLGALYHHHRNRKWERASAAAPEQKPRPVLVENQAEPEPEAENIEEAEGESEVEAEGTYQRRF
ncbi:MAG: DoxX family membrane protein [Terriglobales bacterium]